MFLGIKNDSQDNRVPFIHFNRRVYDIQRTLCPRWQILTGSYCGVMDFKHVFISATKFAKIKK